MTPSSAKLIWITMKLFITVFNQPKTIEYKDEVYKNTEKKNLTY